MELLFERTMSLKQYASACAKMPPVFIAGYGGRTKKVQEALGVSQVIELKHEEGYTTSSSTSADIKDCIEIYINGECTRKLSSADEVEPYFLSVLQKDTAVFIDITSMSVRLLAIVLSSLAFVLADKPEIPGVYCGYAELKAYNRRGILSKKEAGKQSQFELYSDFAPLGPLPNFVSIGSDEDKQLWVVLLGFEGYRTGTIHDELSRIDDIIALVTIPSLKLGWSNYAVAENSHFLRGIDHCLPTINYVAAVSPFSVYNTLCELQEKYSEYRLQISPFSTKVNSLGVLLYALNNPECSLVFDNPLEKSRPQEEHSDIYHVYEVTEPLKRAGIGKGDIDENY